MKVYLKYENETCTISDNADLNIYFTFLKDPILFDCQAELEDKYVCFDWKEEHVYAFWWMESDQEDGEMQSIYLVANIESEFKDLYDEFHESCEFCENNKNITKNNCFISLHKELKQNGYVEFSNGRHLYSIGVECLL